MVGQPEHPLSPAFAKAREWEAEQERRLTEPQRNAFAALKEKQEKARLQQQAGIEAVRSQLQERAKNRKLKANLELNPPVKIADPYIRRQARFVIAGEKRLERLDRRHAEERIKTLKTFENEREQQRTKPDKQLTDSWRQALQKTAAKEQDRSNNKTRDLSDEHDKSR